jgi:hypothetical protein
MASLTVTDIEYINERVVKVDSTANNRDRDSINTGLFDDYCRRTGGNNALLILCDQLEAQDSSKAWHHLCRAEAALWQNVAKMMLKPERCWVVWILFSSVTQIVHK